MKILIYLAGFTFCLFSVLYDVDAQTIPKSGKYAYEIFQNQDKTYGYSILNKGKKVIQQSVIPGRPGNKGFAKKEDAEKVAKLVVSKVEKGMMPPTVTEAELKKLNL
ncbi:MAG: DUF4907 domain-containing protein [Bacteroidia bacterium]|jgi:hypothetical protein